MRYDPAGSALATMAFVAASAMPAGARADAVVWVSLCDAAHPERRIPVPIRRDPAPPAGCHAASVVATAPRLRR